MTSPPPSPQPPPPSPPPSLFRVGQMVWVNHGATQHLAHILEVKEDGSKKIKWDSNDFVEVIGPDVMVSAELPSRRRGNRPVYKESAMLTELVIVQDKDKEKPKKDKAKAKPQLLKRAARKTASATTTKKANNKKKRGQKQKQAPAKKKQQPRKQVIAAAAAGKQKRKQRWFREEEEFTTASEEEEEEEQGKEGDNFVPPPSATNAAAAASAPAQRQLPQRRKRANVSYVESEEEEEEEKDNQVDGDDEGKSNENKAAATTTQLQSSSSSSEEEEDDQEDEDEGPVFLNNIGGMKYAVGTHVAKKCPRNGWISGTIVGIAGTHYRVKFPKKRQKVNATDIAQMVYDADTTRYPVGMVVKKKFTDKVLNSGSVVEIRNSLYRVIYKDGAEEDLGASEMDEVVALAKQRKSIKSSSSASSSSSIIRAGSVAIIPQQHQQQSRENSEPLRTQTAGQSTDSDGIIRQTTMIPTTATAAQTQAKLDTKESAKQPEEQVVENDSTIETKQSAEINSQEEDDAKPEAQKDLESDKEVVINKLVENRSKSVGAAIRTEDDNKEDSKIPSKLAEVLALTNKQDKNNNGSAVESDKKDKAAAKVVDDHKETSKQQSLTHNSQKETPQSDSAKQDKQSSTVPVQVICIQKEKSAATTTRTLRHLPGTSARMKNKQSQKLMDLLNKTNTFSTQQPPPVDVDSTESKRPDNVSAGSKRKLDDEATAKIFSEVRQKSQPGPKKKAKKEQASVSTAAKKKTPPPSFAELARMPNTQSRRAAGALKSFDPKKKPKIRSMPKQQRPSPAQQRQPIASPVRQRGILYSQNDEVARQRIAQALELTARKEPSTSPGPVKAKAQAATTTSSDTKKPAPKLAALSQQDSDKEKEHAAVAGWPVVKPRAQSKVASQISQEDAFQQMRAEAIKRARLYEMGTWNAPSRPGQPISNPLVPFQRPTNESHRGNYQGSQFEHAESPQSGRSANVHYPVDFQRHSDPSLYFALNRPSGSGFHLNAVHALGARSGQGPVIPPSNMQGFNQGISQAYLPGNSRYGRSGGGFQAYSMPSNNSSTNRYLWSRQSAATTTSSNSKRTGDPPGSASDNSTYKGALPPRY